MARLDMYFPDTRLMKCINQRRIQSGTTPFCEVCLVDGLRDGSSDVEITIDGCLCKRCRDANQIARDLDMEEEAS